jgi:hypothetical protein
MEDNNAAVISNGPSPTSDYQNSEAAVATMHESEEDKMMDNEEDMMDNNEEEEEEEEEEAPTISDTKEEPTNSGRVKRERKSIEAFNPANTAVKVKEIYPEGKGTKLKDMPNVVANLQAITWSDPHLRMLHQIIFGGNAKKKELKSDLLEFSGIVYSKGKTEDDIKAKMYKLKMDDLKEVMDLVDVDRSTKSFGLAENKSPDKEDHCIRLLEWLEKPKASGNKKGKLEKAAPKKRKSSEGGGKKSKVVTKVSPAPPVKKAKKTAETKEKKVTPKPAKSQVTNSVADEFDLNIPGVDIDKLKAKVKSIVENGNRQELTVKSIRVILEEWLDTDLTEHKDAIRSIVMDAM